jgi:entericidin B
MRKLFVIFTAMTALAVAGCNTVAGAGQDVSAAGHAVTHTAEDAKPQ